MSRTTTTAFVAAAGFALSIFGTATFADTIDPPTYECDLAVGESCTVRKTVVVEDKPTEAILDVMFIIDTTGSMGSAIANAKTAAQNIIDGLSGFGDVHTGAGFYNDPAFDGVQADLSGNDAATKAQLNSYFASGGGDFPEKGNHAIKDAADNASWRPGSNRFIIVLGDSSFRDDGPSDAAVMTSLSDNNVELIGLRFLNFDFSDPDSNEDNFDESIAALGGTSLPGGTSPDDIVDAILDGVSASLEEYTKVTLSDFGDGMPEIGLDVKCISADIGDCVDDTAVGEYDRSEDRKFVFDVTFTRKEGGDRCFGTRALVDGGVVATEKDCFPDDGGEPNPIPLPATAWFMMLDLQVSRRRVGASRKKKNLTRLKKAPVSGPFFFVAGFETVCGGRQIAPNPLPDPRPISLTI